MSRTSDTPVCIGVALSSDDLEVAIRVAGEEIARARFPAGALGVAALLGYLADQPAPLRLAVAGAAALGFALAAGAAQGREVFLLALPGAAGVSGLACYAERAV